MNTRAVLLTAAVALCAPAFGQEWTPDKGQVVEQPRPYSPYVDRHFPQRVFFGAFYYVRVIEIPKPRWTAYDAKFFKVKMPKEVTMIVQDRAYTSPIWYTPSN